MFSCLVFDIDHCINKSLHIMISKDCRNQLSVWVLNNIIFHQEYFLTKLVCALKSVLSWKIFIQRLFIVHRTCVHTWSEMRANLESEKRLWPSAERYFVSGDGEADAIGFRKQRLRSKLSLASSDRTCGTHRRCCFLPAAALILSSASKHTSWQMRGRPSDSLALKQTTTGEEALDWIYCK